MTHPLQRISDRLGGIAYGGDYNPEQWPEEVWAEDMALMRQSGVNLVTVGVFSWSRLQPRPDTWNWAWLDRILDLLHANNIAVDLATPTAAPPPWLTHAHAEALPVTVDGIRLSPGSRQGFCPSSPAYAQAADHIVGALAARYTEHPAVALWHVHNEWGNHNGLCYCDASAAAFRRWLQERHGTLEALNDAWGTDFWSQRYGDWEEILPPRATPAFRNPSQELDFRRFSSDALLNRHRAETAILREHAPRIPVTTNLMGTLEKKVDGFAFADECDLISVDHYLTAADPHSHIGLALNADLARGMAGRSPWLLMEHSTSAVNWQGVNVAKQPGQMQRNSLAHIARGADGVLFFQWRQSRAGAEKWHSAMLPHGGTSTRIWREVTALGSQVHQLAEIRGTRVVADVAMLFDWPAWWGLELEARPSTELDYLQQIHHWYAALWSLGITCDVIAPSADLHPYRAVLAPSLYLTSDADAASLRDYVAAGGHAAVGCFSGVADSNDHIRPGGHPGAYRDMLGLTVDEYLPLHPDESVLLSNGEQATQWAERLTLRGAGAHLRFGDGPAAAGAAVTTHRHGAGTAWYVATCPSERTLAEVLACVCDDAGAVPPAPVPPGIEAVRRTDHRHSYLFLINHTEAPADVAAAGVDVMTGNRFQGATRLSPGQVAVLREETAPVQAAGVQSLPEGAASQAPDRR